MIPRHDDKKKVSYILSMPEAHSKEHILYGSSLADIPVLSTILLGTALHVMSRCDRERARLVYVLTVVFAMVSVIVPMLHRIYVDIKPRDHPIGSLFKHMASITKVSLWLSLSLFILAVVLDNDKFNVLEFVAWIAAVALMTVILVIYGREFARHSGD